MDEGATAGSVPEDGSDTRNRDERLRRPALARTAPYRAWTGGQMANGDSSAVAGLSELPRLAMDLVTQSVEAGYRVIDEYIRGGQEVARTLSGRSTDRAALGGLPIASDAFGSLFASAMTFWAEVVSTALPLPSGAAGREAHRPGPSATASHSAMIEVPEVTIVVAAGASSSAVFLVPAGYSGPLVALDLVAINATPITGAIAHAHPGGAATFMVAVHDGKPEGVYAGAVISPTGTEVLATIKLVVGPPGAV